MGTLSGAGHGMLAAVAVAVQVLPAISGGDAGRLKASSASTHCPAGLPARQSQKIAIKYAAGACVVKMFQASTSAGHDGSDVLLRKLGVRCMYATEPFGMLQRAGSVMQEVSNAMSA